MSSVKVKFKTCRSACKGGRVIYQITFNHKTRTIVTPFSIFEDEWDYQNNKIIIRTNEQERIACLQYYQKRILLEEKRLWVIMDLFSKESSDYSVLDVEAEFDKYVSNTFYSYMEKKINDLQCNGQYRTSETYQSALNSFMSFNGYRDLYFDEINGRLMIAYEHYLKQRNVCLNTISFYMRRLRAIYNKAVEDGLSDQKFPFKHVYTSFDKTSKRALSVSCIKRLKQIDLSDSMFKGFARDIFMFSFYTRGMSLIDIVYLKKKSLRNNILTYYRKKTRQKIEISWEDCMQEFVEKYKAKDDSPYLLSIIDGDGIDAIKMYRKISAKINYSLKKIGLQLGLCMPLTMYVARHSWASIAYHEGIPLSIISKGLGHESEMITRVYIDSLESSIVDKANRQIINLV